MGWYYFTLHWKFSGANQTFVVVCLWNPDGKKNKELSGN